MNKSLIEKEHKNEILELEKEKNETYSQLKDQHKKDYSLLAIECNKNENVFRCTVA